jgi:undecaprenyl-diphosphatase
MPLSRLTPRLRALIGHATSLAAAVRDRSLSELAPLLLLFLAATALFAFGQIAAAVIEGDTRGFDEAVMRSLRTAGDLADPIGPPWLEEGVRDLTALGSIVVLTLLTIAVLGFLLIDGKRATALYVLVAVGGGALLSTLAKTLFARPRPELVAHLVEVTSYSFPSGHATSSAVTYLTLGVLLASAQRRKRIKAYLIGVALTLTLLVGTSRVYLGVHWPTDVLAGWALGAAWAMLSWLGSIWLQRAGRIEPASADDG